MKITKITDTLSVASQINPDDVAEIAKSGFVSIINNRPDGEELNQPKGLDIAAAAASANIAYVHQPVISGNITKGDIDAFGASLEFAKKPVLAFCRTGTRCCALWLLNNKEDPDKALAHTRSVGYNLDFLRPQL